MMDVRAHKLMDLYFFPSTSCEGYIDLVSTQINETTQKISTKTCLNLSRKPETGYKLTKTRCRICVLLRGRSNRCRETYRCHYQLSHGQHTLCLQRAERTQYLRGCGRYHIRTGVFISGYRRRAPPMADVPIRTPPRPSATGRV